jgi:mono/diheme cytochrome c family protein
MKHAIPALALLALTAAACGGGDSKTTPSAEAPKTTAPAATPAATTPAATAQTAPAATGAPTAADKAAADKIFATRCTPCHGSSGKGDGAAAAALNPRPRNYMDKAWQSATKDETIAKAIVGGGTAVGLSALMPPNPDLASKPAVVQALVDKIRGFAN